MKKLMSILLVAVLTLSLFSVAYADKAVAEEASVYSFARNYTVDSVTSSKTKIMEDSNWYDETNIACTWKSTSGPMSVRITCYLKYNGEWFLYSQRDLTAVKGTANFTVNGGEPFRLYVQKLSGNDGACSFGVTLI